MHHHPLAVLETLLLKTTATLINQIQKYEKKLK